MDAGRDVVDRCTRAGVTSWSNVAKQLGVSVDRARRLYDPVSSSRRDPQQLAGPAPESLTDAEAYRSPNAKGAGLKAVILTLLERHRHLTVDEMAKFTGSSNDTMRPRLSALRRAGLVQNDQAGDRIGRTWVLTAAGRAIARTYRDRPGKPDVGPGSPSIIGQAA